MPISASKPGTVIAATLLGATTLTTGATLADRAEEPTVAEFTDLAIEVVDIGFCNMQDIGMSDADIRAALVESGGETWLSGNTTTPQEALLHGVGLFTPGASDSAMAASLQAFLVPEEGDITLFCLVLLPLARPEADAGDFALKGFETFTDGNGAGPAYVLLGQVIGRDVEGEDIHIAYLEDGEGALSFIAEGDAERRQPEGAEAYIEVTFDGRLSDGQPVAFAFNSALFEGEHLNFMYLNAQ